jgi:flagellar motor switch protein FliM
MSMDLRRMVDIEPGRIRLIKFREFLNSLPVPSCLSLFTMEPLTGSGLITFDSEFIFLLVDLFCGGLGKTRFRIEGREFTSIEQGIVGKVVIRALAQMSDAWEALYPVTVNFTRTEINPQFINLAHPTEIVVRFTAAIDIEGVGGTMSIVLPYSMIEPIKGKLERGVIGERIELERIWRESMEGKIIESDVDMTGVLGKLNLSIGKLIKLKVDDILELDTGVDDLMTVEVQGRPKFYGRTGRHKGYKAVQILEVAE